MSELPAVPPRDDIARPTLRGYLAHFGEVAVYSAAFFGPTYAVSRFDWLDGPQPERVMYWKLFAIVAWHTLLALCLAGRLLQRAWQIHRRGEWPDADAFVPFPTVVRRDWRVRLQSGSAVLLAAVVLVLLGTTWRALGVPGLFLAGYGEGIVGGPGCPRSVESAMRDGADTPSGE